MSLHTAHVISCDIHVFCIALMLIIVVGFVAVVNDVDVYACYGNVMNSGYKKKVFGQRKKKRGLTNSTKLTTHTLAITESYDILSFW